MITQKNVAWVNEYFEGALNALEIDTRNQDTGDFLNFFDVLDQLYSKWDSLSEKQKKVVTKTFDKPTASQSGVMVRGS